MIKPSSFKETTIYHKKHVTGNHCSDYLGMGGEQWAQRLGLLAKLRQPLFQKDPWRHRAPTLLAASFIGKDDGLAY